MINKFLTFLIYFVVALSSFILFLYLSFPYHVLKLSMLSKLSDSLSYQVRSEKLSHEFPLGLSLNKVEIENPGVSKMSFEKISVSTDFWSLFFGSLNVRLGIKDSVGGDMTLLNQFDLLKFATTGNERKMSPSVFRLRAEDFDVGQIINFFLESKSQDPKVNLLVAPFIESLSVQSKIKSEIEFKSEGDSYSSYSGTLDVDFKNSKIIFDESTGLPGQLFTKAQIKANLAGGVLNVDKRSILESDQMSIGLSGSVKQNEKLERSLCNLFVKVDLKDELKDQLSFILDVISEQTTNGSLSMNIKGPFVPGPRISYN